MNPGTMDSIFKDYSDKHLVIFLSHQLTSHLTEFLFRLKVTSMYEYNGIGLA